MVSTLPQRGHRRCLFSSFVFRITTKWVLFFFHTSVVACSAGGFVSELQRIPPGPGEAAAPHLCEPAPE